MKRLASMVALLALSGAIPVALAQQSGAPTADAPKGSGDGPPGVIVGETTTAKAKVTDIDRTARKVTLQGEDGTERTLTLGPEVRNFDQIEVGDTVTAEFIEATAVFVRAPDEPPSGAALSSVQVAPKGAKPGAVMTDQIETTATIDEIDYANRTVTLRNAEGETRQINVDERVQNLERFKKGDEVVIRHTEALAIEVTK